MFTRQPSVSIVVKDGGSLKIVERDNSTHHYHIHGPAEVVAPKGAVQVVRALPLKIGLRLGRPEVKSRDDG